jgi:cytoskeletal protein RodZ
MADERQVDFGTFLRQAREQRGLSLQQLALTTKISARVLEALERNDPSKLPGGIFSRSFVRAYAREVGLDPDAAVAGFVSAFPDEAGADEMTAATSAVEAESFQLQRRVVRVLLRMLGVAMLVAILALVYYSWSGRKPVAESPGAGAAPAAGPATQVPAPPQARPSAPETGLTSSPGTGASSEPAPGTVQSEPAPPPAAQPTPSAEPAGTPVSPPAGGSLQAPLVVVLSVSGSCWLSVSVDGTRMPSRTFSAGERIEYAVQRSITMTAGNAGALSLTLNGKPARALGGAGEVVTTTISASGYENFLLR